MNDTHNHIDSEKKIKSVNAVAMRPTWRRPEVSILDVEGGTVATTGPVTDGAGSTHNS